MKRLVWGLWRVLMVALLLGVGVKSGVMAMGNWWAAGTSPKEDAAAFERLGNVLFGLSVLCLFACATIGVDAIRDWLRRRRA
jgi:hypothetical protein